MLGLTLGVRHPQERYLEIDDNLYVALYAGGHGGRQPERLAAGERRRGMVDQSRQWRRPARSWARDRSGMRRTWLRISGMITWTGGRSCVRSGPCSSAR